MTDALPVTDKLELKACIWKRADPDEWVLEIEGEANDCCFVTRHTAPIDTPLEDVAGLKHLYTRHNARDLSGDSVLCSHPGTCADNLINHNGAFCANRPHLSGGEVERVARAIEAVRTSVERADFRLAALFSGAQEIEGSTGRWKAVPLSDLDNLKEAMDNAHEDALALPRLPPFTPAAMSRDDAGVVTDEGIAQLLERLRREPVLVADQEPFVEIWETDFNEIIAALTAMQSVRAPVREDG